MSNSLLSGIVYGASSMILVAVSMKLRLRTLDTNGKLLEALRLHSMTFTSRPFARNWMLNGPEMLSSLAIARLIFLICLMVAKRMFWAGKTIVASPEWTPAYSMCSLMPYSTISPLRATASNSISLVSVMNWEMTTG